MTTTHVAGYINPYALNVTHEVDRTSPFKYHASSDSTCLTSQLPTSKAVTLSFTDTNSSNTEVDNKLTPLQSDSSQFQVISSWVDEAIKEAETRPSFPLTINNDIRDINPEAEQAKLIELYRDIDNCERTPEPLSTGS
ncbi:14723_t:CDS:1 [Acaulospora colombiana]|uniref:14723_t:CDS:1 n=1 Tax=Acaulospora colombiana TaxID=27376 RepID=A0ACA9K404_9GLOM|nr:14723_t:CDS:1 [Acaulospora colombiana]